MRLSVRISSMIATLTTLCVLASAQAAMAQVAPTSTATISGKVTDAAGKSVVGAKVTLSGPRSVTGATDSSGSFSFIGMPFGSYRVSVESSLGRAVQQVAVTGDIIMSIEYQVSTLKTIAHASTGAAAARFNVSPASVTEVNPMQLSLQGVTQWRQILEQIPGVAQTGLYNGNYISASIPDSPLMPVQLSINGALPYETATLLDGMPLIGGSFGGSGEGYAGGGTSLDLYSLEAFSSADVVRGPGASSPTIVDSIGGSFVLHAPGPATENHLDLSVSSDPYGGVVGRAIATVHSNNFSATLSYGLNDSPGPVNRAIPVPGYFVPPETIDGKPFVPYTPPCSPPSCQYGGYLFAPEYTATAFPYVGFRTGLLTCCTQASTAWSQHSGSITLNYEISPALSAKIFYAGQSSEVYSGSAPEFTTEFLPPAGYSGSIGQGSFLLPGVNWYNAAGLAANPMLESSSLVMESVTARLFNGSLNLAAFQNRTFLNCGVSNPVSAVQQLYGGGSVAGTPTVFNGGSYNVTYPIRSDYLIADSGNRDLLASYVTPIGNNYHVGASFVNSYYNSPNFFSGDFGGFIESSAIIPADDYEATNETRLFFGGNPSDNTTIDLSLYSADATYHVQDPSVQPGVAYTNQTFHYSAPRLGFVWQPTSDIAVRAAAGGGFALAPLYDLVGTNGQPVNSGHGYYTETLKNLNLLPETSFGIDLGADWRTLKGPVVSVDVYNTTLHGQFYNGTSASGLYNGLPLYVTENGNLGTSRYEGALLSVRDDAPHGVFWDFSGGLTRGYVVSVPSTFYNTAGGTCNHATLANCQNLEVVPNVNFNGSFTVGATIPYAQGLVTVGYRWNPATYVNIVGTYFGNNNTYFRRAFAEFDGHISYGLSKNVSILLTALNLTGVYDGAIQTYSIANLSGAPTIAGAPYPLYGEMYGPRAVIVTTKVSI